MWGRQLCPTSCSLPCLLLSPVKVCQEEILIGAESSHGVKGENAAAGL